MAKVDPKKRDEQLRKELSVMLSELNELRMRIDAVVRRLADGDADAAGADHASVSADELRSMQALRARLSSQVDRIREKVIARMPEST